MPSLTIGNDVIHRFGHEIVLVIIPLLNKQKTLFKLSMHFLVPCCWVALKTLGCSKDMLLLHNNFQTLNLHNANEIRI